MKANYLNKEYLDPFEATEMAYWTHKWHVTPQQVYNAIMDTGSFRVKELEQKVSVKKEASSFWEKLMNLMR